MHKRRQTTDDDDGDQELSHIGHLTQDVDWGNPHFRDGDDDGDLQVLKLKRRKVAVSSDESETEPESQDEEEHAMWLANQQFRRLSKRQKELEAMLDDTDEDHRPRKDVGKRDRDKTNNNDCQTRWNTQTQVVFFFTFVQIP
jgi:hypothetical protein